MITPISNSAAQWGVPGATKTDAPPRAGDPHADSSAPNQLSPDDLARINELASKDREVRAHEMAHLAAAGPYARGGPTFSYQTGPDGRRYAIGGEVQIDTSSDPHNPRATLIKAQIVQAAATAPANPSGQDRAVAAAAAQMAMQARRDLAAQESETAHKREQLQHTVTPHNAKDKTLGNHLDVYA